MTRGRAASDSPELVSLRAKAAANESWARTRDRSGRTAPARAAALARFERQVDPDGLLSPQERASRAESARKAYMQRLAVRSVESRRRRRLGRAG